MEQSSSCEANSRSVGEEILRLSWKLSVHYRFHKTLPVIPIQSYMNPLHTPSFHFVHVYFCVAIFVGSLMLPCRRGDVILVKIVM